MIGNASPDPRLTSETNSRLSHLARFGEGTLTKCLYQFDEPVSPHIAAKQKTVSRMACDSLSDD